MKLSEQPKFPPHLLLFGPYGQGKTALLETLGEHLLLFDFDNGAEVGLNLKDKFHPNRTSIDVFPLRETNPMAGTAWGKFKERLVQIVNECTQGKFKPRAVGVDSLTTMGEASMRFILGNSNHIGKPPTQPEWGLAMLEVQYAMDLLKSLPVVVVVIAHDEKEVVDGRNVTQISVIGKKLTPKIPTYFPEVWYIKAEGSDANRKYLIQTKATSDINVRSRHNLADKLDANLGMVELLKMMNYDINQPPQTTTTASTPAVTPVVRTGGSIPQTAVKV